MYCKACGKQLDDGAQSCPACGCKFTPPQGEVVQPPVQTPAPEKSNPPKTIDSNIIAVVGFVLAFMVPIAGLICCWIGRKNAREQGLPNGTLATAGFVISLIQVILYAIGILIYFLFLFSLIGFVR